MLSKSALTCLPDRVQQAFGVHALAAVHFCVNQPAAVYRDFGYFLAESKHNTLAPQIRAKRLDYFLIGEIQKSGPLLDHCDFDAERRKHRSVLESACTPAPTTIKSRGILPTCPS